MSQFTTLPAAIYQDGRHDVGQLKYQRILSSASVLDVNYGQIRTPFPQEVRPVGRHKHDRLRYRHAGAV